MTELFIVLFILTASYPVYKAQNMFMFRLYLITAVLFLVAHFTQNASTITYMISYTVAMASLLHLLWRVGVEYYCVKSEKIKEIK